MEFCFFTRWIACILYFYFIVCALIRNSVVIHNSCTADLPSVTISAGSMQPSIVSDTNALVLSIDNVCLRHYTYPVVIKENHIVGCRLLKSRLWSHGDLRRDPGLNYYD